MTVYVDAAVHEFRGMLMCHMWSDSLPELLAMVDAIGVERRWLQQPPKASWIHFDISKGKRTLAVKLGAVETDRYGPAEHVARLDLASGDRDRMDRGRISLARIESCRHRRTRAEAETRIQGDLFG